MRLLYEELMAAPEPSLLRIQAFAGGGSWAAGEFSLYFEAKPFHTLGGNRVRFERGNLRVDVDREWRERMPTRDKMLVSALTSPLLTAYGYVHL
jgi:hypothetical protein